MSGFPQFLGMARELLPELVRLRRQIHQNPELGFEEHRTARLVAETLRELNIEVTEGIAKTGVVGLLKGQEDGRVVALRADMDALPLEEKTGLPFASRNQGVMHACGHDAHTAMLLGAAMLLSQVRDRLPGRVKFIFQPCEESPPGGAQGMIQEGVLDKPKVGGIFGLHVNPLMPAGTIGLKEGTVMAAADMFKLVIKGKGGHGATPHHTVDSIVVAAHVIQALQTIPSRYVDPVKPVVLSIGTIHGGTKSNIIAGEVKLSGTVRTLDPSLRERIPELMEKMIKGVSSAFGAECSFEYERGFPPVVNHSQMVELVRRAAAKIVGSKRCFPIKQPSMGGEDFAYYVQRVPGAFFHLGVAKKEGPNYPWHHPQFDIAEEALPVGAAILAQIAVDFLRRQGLNEESN